MRKILALILIVGCIFAFASCSLFGGKDDTPPADVASIQKAIDDSAPASAKITVELNSSLGDLNGEYNVAFNDDGSATINYSYELFNEFNIDSIEQGFKSTYTGVVSVSADGVLSEEIGGIASAEAVSFDISLKEELFETVSVEASVLRGTVKADNTYDVLGVALDYDVELVILTGSGRVTSIIINYVAESGPIEITATYRY